MFLCEITFWGQCGTTIIAFCSMIVAVAALGRSFKIDKKDAIFKRKADVKAIGVSSEVESSSGYHSAYFIRVWNEGESVAKNIRFESDYIGEGKGYVIVNNKTIPPYPLLNKGEAFEMLINIYKKSNPAPMIKLIWDDNYKVNNERLQTLEFF